MELRALVEEHFRKHGITNFVAHEDMNAPRFTINYPPFAVDLALEQNSLCLTISAYLRLTGSTKTPSEFKVEENESTPVSFDDFSLRAEVPFKDSRADERSVEHLLSVLLDLCKQYAEAIREPLHKRRRNRD
jgi:hypothetical protein